MFLSRAVFISRERIRLMSSSLTRLVQFNHRTFLHPDLSDSVGTLTYGKPMVTDHKLLTERLTRKRFFELVGLAESSSEHILGKQLFNLFKTG